MSIGTEYITSNTQIAYPFKEDCTGLARDNVAVHGSDGTARLPVSAVVDAIAYLPEKTTAVSLIQVEAVGGGLYTFTFNCTPTSVITGDCDINALDTSNTYSVITFGTSDSSVSLVVLTQVLVDYLTGCTLDTYAYPDVLTFESRVITDRLPHLTSLTLYSDILTPSSDELTGKLLFVEGYNTTYTTQRDTDDTTLITLNAIPGTGLGRYPCDDDPKITKRFLGLVPENGNINIVGDICYNIIPGTTTQITSSCTACCSCEDYANATKAAKRLLNHSQLTLKKLDEGREAYNSGVLEYNEYMTRTVLKPTCYMRFSLGEKSNPDKKKGSLAKAYNGPLTNSHQYLTITVKFINKSVGCRMFPACWVIPYTNPGAKYANCVYLRWCSDGPDDGYGQGGDACSHTEGYNINDWITGIPPKMVAPGYSMTIMAMWKAQNWNAGASYYWVIPWLNQVIMAQPLTYRSGRPYKKEPEDCQLWRQSYWSDTFQFVGTVPEGTQERTLLNQGWPYSEDEVICRDV